MASIYDGLYGYKLRKLYTVAKRSKDNRKNLAYDYKDKIMKNSVSPHIYRNDVMRDFLDFINDYVYNKIQSVRRLKLFKAFTVDKDYDIE
jgi:hypothetical protein